VITNLGRTAFRIGDHGNEIGDPVPTGGVLYEGPASTIACATTPYYGRGVKMFPFATRRAGRFQLRVSNLTATQAALNVRRIWNGTMRHASLSDYYVDRVRIRCDDAMPYQLGGDARGYRNEMIFSLSEQPVRLVGKA
jgi:diacylglycerol kinase family enzyme